MAGLAILGAAFGVILDRLTSPELVNFFRGRNHDEELLNELNLKLLELQVVLDDAENKQITSSAVKHWLNELKDAVYHAEDLVDEIATAALRCKVEAEYESGSNQVQSLISTITKSFDKDIESNLKKIIGKLDYFVKAKHGLGLKEVVGDSLPRRPPTTYEVDESCVYGRENEREEIMKLLLSDGERSNKIDVIPIVGMGGVGKTTLAQLLYNDHRLKSSGHFVKKAWVCVSDVFDVSAIIITIVEALTEKACDTKNPNLLTAKLKESLSETKFLIVLDDVWNENYEDWDALMTLFKLGAHGSKIIVTTRNDGVASMMQTILLDRLQALPEEHCWELFCQHAFVSGDPNAHPNLETIGKEIVKKCKGLPLAAKILGGLLRFQQDVKDWNKVLKSAIWELPEKKSNILPALKLSYLYLPSHLKRCFAYCSIFVKDHEFNVEELVSFWMAEGFLVKPRDGETLEDEGNECFQELLSRSFFQRSRMKDSLFLMHDLVHDLAQHVMGDFYYRLEDGKPKRVDEKVRHFSFDQNKILGFEEFKVITRAKSLRTFLPSPQAWWWRKSVDDMLLIEILPRLTRLRLLSLSKFAIQELPDSISNLIHLRLLDLSKTKIKELPEPICMLYNLETLLLVGCDLLTTLPPELGKLISLRHLDLSGTNLKEMPMNIGGLKDLQRLTVFVVGKCTATGINHLREFRFLRGTISILGLQNVKSGNDASEAKMSEKKHLEKLALEWNSTTEDSRNARDVLEKLEPHTNLKHLEIKNYGGTRFPNWLGDQSFCNMVSLRLEDCENCVSLPPLGQLPSLKKLTIARMPGITEVGSEFYGEESASLSKLFQSLETLHFEQMVGWVDWCMLDAVEFSRLQKLAVIDCPELIRHLPTKVPSLVKLEIRNCPKLVASLPNTTSLRKLVMMSGCQGVQVEWQGVPSIESLIIESFTSWEELPSELVTLKNLKDLTLRKCPRLTNLKDLRLRACPRLYVEEEMSHCYTSLEKLSVWYCTSLKSIPLDFFPKLRSLDISDCENFETLLIPDEIELRNSTSLETLIIFGCDNMLSFPCGGLPAPNLSSLSLSCCWKLKALPEQMHTLLPSLQSLTLDSCPEIDSFPEGGLPSKLRHLYIIDCKKLVGGRRDWGLQTLPSLTFLLLLGEDMLESFPEEGLLPPTIESLSFGKMPNLKSINERGLQPLRSLEYMEIDRCPQLQSLSAERLPTSLLELKIEDCPLLKPRCRREEGEDWHKIAHIPLIIIDREVISE